MQGHTHSHHVDVHVRKVRYEVISDQEPQEDPIIQYLLQIISKGEFPLLLRHKGDGEGGCVACRDGRRR